MANSNSVRSGLQTLMQDHLSDKIVSTLFNTMPLPYFLMGKDGNKDGFRNIGRPKAGAVLSGLPISKTRMESVLNSDKYMPIINSQGPAESDGKVMGLYDTLPTRSNWNTTAPSSYFKRPMFKWVERADPIMVPNKEIRRTISSAGNEQKASAAVGDLFRAESDLVLATHLQWWNKQFWNSSAYPSNEDSDTWDSIHGLSSALNTTNSYAGLDRSLTANSWWRGQRVTSGTTVPASIEYIVNDALYTRGIAKKGIGVNLVLCGADLFPVFKAEAKAKGGVITYGDLPEIGEFGFKKEVVRFNNTYVVYDPQCPCVANGDTYNVVVVLNLDTWTLALNPRANFTVDEPFDLSKTEGGKDAMKSQIRTEMIFACEVPSLNVYYENVA